MDLHKGYNHTVQYYETDKMGITHHSNYIRWMEEARVDFLKQIIGWNLAQVQTGLRVLKEDRGGLQSGADAVRVGAEVAVPAAIGDDAQGAITVRLAGTAPTGRTTAPHWG